MSSNNDQPRPEAPYKGELYGIQQPYFAAHGPGAHIVCTSRQQAGEIAAALNAAFTAGRLFQLHEAGQ